VNVLVTGSSGFLGGSVCDLFLKHGHTVYGVSRGPYNKNFQQYAIDINSFDEINKLISEKDIELVVHTAGKPIVSDCEKNPYDAYKVNGLGTASVLEACRQNNVKKVISVETDKVYGYQEIVPTTEFQIPNPKSPYEFSKYLAATISDFYRAFYSMDIVSVRPANIYGMGDASTSRLIPKALENLKQGKGIRLYDTALEMKRDFIYVEDVAESIYLLATNKCNCHVYNMSANDSYTILELCDKILKALDLDIPHDIVKKSTDFREIPLQEIDGSRFRDEFNYKFTSFEEGIKKTWKLMNEKYNTTTLDG
jgi:nucleoside-diphosphate-sugar epimerase